MLVSYYTEPTEMMSFSSVWRLCLFHTAEYVQTW